MIYGHRVNDQLQNSCVKRYISKFPRYTARSFIPAGLRSASLRCTRRFAPAAPSLRIWSANTAAPMHQLTLKSPIADRFYIMWHYVKNLGPCHPF